MTDPEKVKRTQRAAKQKAYADPESRLKMLARMMANTAVKIGILERTTKCSICGRFGKTHFHHEDYARPLEVIELCQNCHKAAHLKRHPVEMIEHQR